MRVNDFIEQNEDMPILIEAALSDDLCDPLREEIYIGQLNEIPRKLRSLVVVESGWSLINQMNVLTIRKRDIE